MRNELIVLPSKARPLIPERIRGAGIEVSPYEDLSIQRHRRPGDSLLLCRCGEAAVEVLLPAQDEIPAEIGDYTGIIFFPHGGAIRRLRYSAADARLQESIASILYQLKDEMPHESA